MAIVVEGKIRGGAAAARGERVCYQGGAHTCLFCADHIVAVTVTYIEYAFRRRVEGGGKILKRAGVGFEGAAKFRTEDRVPIAGDA